MLRLLSSLYPKVQHLYDHTCKVKKSDNAVAVATRTNTFISRSRSNLLSKSSSKLFSACRINSRAAKACTGMRRLRTLSTIIHNAVHFLWQDACGCSLQRSRWTLNLGSRQHLSCSAPTYLYQNLGLAATAWTSNLDDVSWSEEDCLI